MGSSTSTASPFIHKARAMILAAGRGQRMMPLTATQPKPMLKVKNKPLIEYPLQALAHHGFTSVVINTAWLGSMVSDHFSTKFNTKECTVDIYYSHEDIDFGHALETAGGIYRALPLLEDVFWLLAGDVFAPDFKFDPVIFSKFKVSPALAHLWLVPNPKHNPKGDFILDEHGFLHSMPLHTVQTTYTYSTYALFKKDFFTCDIIQNVSGIASGNPQGIAMPLAPLLRLAMQHKLVTGEIYMSQWTDVGTPERLAEINQINNF